MKIKARLWWSEYALCGEYRVKPKREREKTKILIKNSCAHSSAYGWTCLPVLFISFGSYALDAFAAQLPITGICFFFVTTIVHCYHHYNLSMAYMWIVSNTNSNRITNSKWVCQSMLGLWVLVFIPNMSAHFNFIW